MVVYVLLFDFHNMFTLLGTDKFCVQVFVADIQFQEVVHEGQYSGLREKTLKKKIESSSN